MKNNKNINFFQSVKHAFCGIIYCIENERNFRFDICASVFVIILSRFYIFSKSEIILLCLTISMVIGFEILNTAVEKTVDLISPQYNKLAKIAKDCSAGAVLVCAIGAVFVGFKLFWNTEVFIKIYTYFSHNLLSLLDLFIFIIISYLFIYKCFKGENKNNIKE